MGHPSIAVDSFAERNNIEVELASLLESVQFRNSKRSSAFLRYVVEQAVAGNLQALKERTIGASVFGRSEDYDTSADSFVRVRANDVRRRLSSYYESNLPRAGVRIELEPGTYVPGFKNISTKAAALDLPMARLSRWKVRAKLVMALLFGPEELFQRLCHVVESGAGDNAVVNNRLK